MEQWLPEENLEQGSVDYEELAANNGVVVTDSEDHLLSMFYGYTPAVGDVLTFESMDGKAIEVTVMGIAKPSVTSGTAHGACLPLQKNWPISSTRTLRTERLFGMSIHRRTRMRSGRLFSACWKIRC